MKKELDNLTKLPEKTKRLIKDELTRDEFVVWTGKPNPFLTKLSFVTIWIVSVPTTVGSIFWVGALITRPYNFDFFSASTMFLILSVAFLNLGLSITILPIFEFLSASSTVHLITNKRILTISGKRKVTISSYWRDDITAMEATFFPDGTGSFVFKKERYLDNDGGSRNIEAGIYHIPDIKGAENAIRQLKNVV